MAKQLKLKGMPAKKTNKSTRKTTKKQPLSKQLAANPKLIKTTITIIALIVFALAVFNLGLVGNYLANAFKFIFGDFFQIILISIALIISYVTFFDDRKIPTRIYAGLGLFTIGLLTFLSGRLSNVAAKQSLSSYVVDAFNNDIADHTLKTANGGGIIGAYIFQVLEKLISNIGTFTFSVVSMLVGLALIVNLFYFARKNEWSKRIKQQGQSIQKSTFFETKQPTAKKKDESNFFTASKTASTKEQTVKEDQAAVNPTINWNPTDETEQASDSVEELLKDVSMPVPEMPIEPTEIATSIVEEVDDNYQISDDQMTDQIETVDNPNYQLPTAQLLSTVKATDQTEEYNQLSQRSQMIHDTLKSFNIEADVTSVSLGPTVTQYELKPAVGVSVKKISNLADDLAMALAAKSIRIQAPIPGKSLVGIEVPNDIQAAVGFRDMIEHTPAHPDKLLTVPLGRNVSGEIVTADLTAMPHLLIAGSTGSGKSVAINGIISSLLMNTKPSQVKLLMVDPKKVELSVYNDVPHLLTPVVSEPRKAAKALQKVVIEMERRYELFSKLGIRNIDGYNQKVEETNKTKGDAMLKMPYIVAIVDELADLMMTVSGDVEPAIIRIAQMGRAAGIHLILATQRPSVDVITGLIKANVPSRIAFAVSSGIDSRTILDQNGAEKLLGKGDMLFAPIGKQPERVQGAFVSDEDVENIANFVRAQQAPQFAASMTVSDEEMNGESGTNSTNSEDELFTEAIAFVREQKKASTSLLQRRYRIGYNRAARLMDDLEAAGIIGAQVGSKPREVFETGD